MSSKALAKFRKTIARCETLAETYELLQAVNAGQEEQGTDVRVPAPTDIIRGAVVLSVAALDAYITDVFAEKLVKYIKKYTPDDSLIQVLNAAGLDTREALTLISMDRPYRRIRTLIVRYYASYTTQKFNVIDDLFLPFRLKNITTNAQAKSGKKRLLASVKKLILRRHKIVHDGDYNSHRRLSAIEAARILKRIKDLEILVKNMDEIICNRV